ncbi:hypothetical protein M413DRAFT_447614 [Hebeloma cylindrosporum]|uniref:Uncharacterized protein n=1 Tax=Hebeloma cylindrosporum TaxID=76867 RepID=A0A0C2YCC7_HEBCY|nr:hypothetical protein M413DRAFT_447614 [Hebeloma cylindrosporum h7]
MTTTYIPPSSNPFQLPNAQISKPMRLTGIYRPIRATFFLGLSMKRYELDIQIICHSQEGTPPRA